MPDREKVIKGLECCIKAIDDCECTDNCPYESQCWYGTIYLDLMRDALELLKAQEMEISRIKNHVDCEAAETTPAGCVGYGRGFNDDEPCEKCKQCSAYNGYGEE